jgi:hypothetical protein
MLQLCLKFSVVFARWNDIGQLDKLTTLSDEKYAVTFREYTAWAIFTRVAPVYYGLHPMFSPFAHGARIVIIDGLASGTTPVGNTILGGAI